MLGCSHALAGPRALDLTYEPAPRRLGHVMEHGPDLKADAGAARDQTDPDDAVWLERFWAGEREVLAQCYREFFPVVAHAVGSILQGADQETVIHEVFYALIASAEMRRSFGGGALGAWLRTVARHRAIDFARRRGRELSLPPEDFERARGSSPPPSAEALDARLITERFKATLPPKWARVFEARFCRQLTQHEAARLLGISRTTLAYQELRVRQRLRRFVLSRRDRGASTPGGRP